MSARRIGLVAWHVLKQNVRDRVLYSIAVFALLLVAASLVISQLTAGQDLKMIKDLGLAAIELAGLLMSVFVGVSLVSQELDRRSIFNVLSKPLPRWEFIVGKYAGLVLTLLGIGGGDMLLGFGLMVLLFIPVARIAASFEDAIRRRDALLALCTALVLLTMTATLIYTMRS